MNSVASKIILRNGIGVYPFPSVESLINFACDNKKILVAINAEKIMHVNDQTRGIINRNIGYCDGAGAVMAMKSHGITNSVKIPGCELWLNIIERLYPQGKSFFLVGGKPEVITSTIIKLKEQFPGINIVGYRDGYLKDEFEKQALINDVANTHPDVVFIAMGSPKQEILMEEMWQRHQAIYQGLGGSFDVYAGRVKRAPEWWVNHNLEFAYRLFKQPSRIKRQLFLVKYYILVKLGKI